MEQAKKLQAIAQVNKYVLIGYKPHEGVLTILCRDQDIRRFAVASRGELLDIADRLKIEIVAWR